MPRKKKDGVNDQITDSVTTENTVWPKVTIGSHSTRTEYEDGRIEFVTDWSALQRDVQNALTEYENSVKVNTIKTKPLRVKKS